MHLLPGFSTPMFEADGVQLTSYSGLEFVLHLFDSAQTLMDNLSMPTEEVVVRSSESTRVLEDRMMAIEQDHRRLNRAVEYKTAIDCELADFRANERFEDWFVVSGLAKIPDDLVGKAWQVQALKDVQEAIVLLMGRQMPIVVVQNITKRLPGAIVTYNVRMVELADSKAIRDKSGKFFVGGVDRRPPALKKIAFQNRVTADTRTRISVMKLMAKRYRDSNPGSKVQVIGYDPRPLIKITPAAGSSDRRVKVYNYIDAVKNLPNNLPEEDVVIILKRISTELSGQIRARFICLSDDMFKDVHARQKASAPRNAEATASGEAAEGNVAENVDARSVTRSDSEMSVTGGGSVSGSEVSRSESGRTRGSKRGASTEAASLPKK